VSASEVWESEASASAVSDAASDAASAVSDAASAAAL
jgi:hypothetical protein